MGDNKDEYGDNTKIMHSGRTPQEYFGVANAPVSRASTIIYPSFDAFTDPAQNGRYGRYGTPITKHFEAAIAELEGGFGAIVAPSGVAAITTALLASLKAGDHLLMVDTVYDPTRDFCDRILSRFGVDVEYYDPAAGKNIAALIRDNTAVIFMESPGSATFDIQDVPAIAHIAKEKGVLSIIDSTWSSGVLFKPFKHDVDVIIHSASKYICGHSDIMMGVIIARTEEIYKPLRRGSKEIGVCTGPDDVYLALRGLRTLPLRIKKSGENAITVIEGIKEHKAIQRIFHPALPEDPNHALWKRDFTGSNGLFSILLKPTNKQALTACIDSLKFFPIGSSWGGYESLLQPQYLKKCRTVNPWVEEGMLLRFQVGLEDPEDLITDLLQALDRVEL